MQSIPFALGQPPVGLTPRQIETRLAALIHECVNQRSTALAGAIAQHIEALRTHPDYRGTWEELCAYRRLAQQWGCLAWLNAVRAQPRERARA